MIQIRHIISRTLGTLNFARLIEWKEVLGLLKPQKGEKVLDVACGGGELSLKIAKRGCQVYGADISTESVKKGINLLRGKAGAHFLFSDAEYLPYKAGCFDKVVCSSSLEHFHNSLRALQEMNRVLKINGIIVLTTDSLSYPMEEDLKEKHRIKYHVVSYYNADQILEEFKQSGFRLLSSKYLFNSWLTSFFYKLLVKTPSESYRHLLTCFFSDLLIPLFLIIDRLVGKRNCGYTLIVKGEKE